MDGSAADLGDRARQLLKTLVKHYIQDGEPVASGTLAAASRMGLSPATIRNVLSDLEDLGYVHSPHTSAGRIPTVRGYRLFVDSLLSPQPMSDAEYEFIQRQLMAMSDHGSNLVESASQILSGMSNMAGVVTVPKHDYAMLRQIEFLPLSDNRVLAILVVNEREVENRILHVGREYTRHELEVAANFLNTEFAGRDLRSIRSGLLSELKKTRQSMDQLMSEAISMAEQAFDSDESAGSYFIAGQTNLMGLEDFSSVERLRSLFEAFNQQHDLLKLFDDCLSGERMHIFIGEESGYTVLDECSLVTSPYTVDGQVVGTLGVIGPTRMDYDRIIPMVESTAKLLGSVLRKN